MSFAKLGTLDVIYTRIEMPRIGAWGAIVEADTGDESTPSGSTHINFESTDALSFVGTILPSIGEDSPVPGRARVLMRAGVNGLLNEVEGKPYENISPRLIIEDIIEDAGEQLESIADVDALSTQRLWVRPRGTGAQALSRFIAESGLTWRFLPTGRVVVLRDVWPAYAGASTLESSANELRRATYALDAPDLLPGMKLDLKNVSRVVHCVRRDGTFRSEVTFL